MNIETPGLSVWIPGVSFKRKMVLTGDVGHPVFLYNDGEIKKRATIKPKNKENESMKKKAALLMCILVMVCSLAACGGKDGDSAGSDSAGKNNDTSSTTPEPEEAKIKGTTESWGIYSEILVPEGMHIRTGNTTDETDENAVWVNKDDNPLNYFYFILSTAEQSQKDIDATKTANAKYNPEEVTVKAGDYEWKGLAYSYLGTDVAQMYATIGDKVINVRMTGFAYNSDYAKAILGSIKLK